MHLKNFSKTPVDSGVFYFIKKRDPSFLRMRRRDY
jgi:hypothetical protein